jgi:hypothetical protein
MLLPLITYQYDSFTQSNKNIKFYNHFFYYFSKVVNKDLASTKELTKLIGFVQNFKIGEAIPRRQWFELGIYDRSILLPFSRALAVEYKLSPQSSVTPTTNNFHKFLHWVARFNAFTLNNAVFFIDNGLFPERLRSNIEDAEYKELNESLRKIHQDEFGMFSANDLLWYPYGFSNDTFALDYQRNVDSYVDSLFLKDKSEKSDARFFYFETTPANREVRFFYVVNLLFPVIFFSFILVYFFGVRAPIYEFKRGLISVRAIFFASNLWVDL